MDYKYIEQLMERYFNCETSLQEEQILRSFFQQEDIPAELLPYRDLFRYQENETIKDTLGDDFDTRILSIIEEPVVQAKRISLKARLYPFFKAAAMVAIFLTVGNAAERSFNTEEEQDFQQTTIINPGMSYQQATSPLEMVSKDIKPVTMEESQTDTLAALIKPLDGIK